MEPPTNRSATPASQATSLSRMMRVADDQEPLWSPDEMAAVFHHQLDTPLEVDLGQQATSALRELATLAGGENTPIRTYRDLLHHPHPPVELLDLAKSFFKRCRQDQQCPLPAEIATILYFLTIVAAKARCGHAISGLEDEAIRHAVAWALDQPWLDDASRRLLREAQAAFGAPR